MGKRALRVDRAPFVSSSSLTSQCARASCPTCRTNDAARPPSSCHGAAGETDWPASGQRVRCQLAHVPAEVFAAGEEICAATGVRDTRAYYAVHQGQEHDPLWLRDEGATQFAANSGSSFNLAHSVPSLARVQLRKHIRTRRLEAIEQLGADRVVKLTFGSGEAQYHLICELYDRVRTVGRRLASTDACAYRGWRR